jgi:hypothetical protein
MKLQVFRPFRLLKWQNFTFSEGDFYEFGNEIAIKSARLLKCFYKLQEN